MLTFNRNGNENKKEIEKNKHKSLSSLFNSFYIFFPSKENRWIGVMFASKAFVQLVTNPFVGPLTNR